MNVSSKEREVLEKLRKLPHQEVNKIIGILELKLYENSLEKQNCKNERNVLSFDSKKI